MKIENYDDATFLVTQIRKTERQIRQIEGMYTKVLLHENDGTLITTVGVAPGCEHDLTEYARKFVQDSVAHLKAQVEKWTEKLDAL
jgi:hypothetical protein